jgi:prolyl oligopeptidase
MDRYQWLEDIEGDASLAWVRAHSATPSGPRFEALRKEILEVLDSEERIPYPYWHGELLYNLWQDAEHPRGLWRRTTLAEYRKPDPAWETLLDLDDLSAREGESWVWQGVDFLRPAGTRCLLRLSRGGADASVVREFDLDAKTFIHSADPADPRAPGAGFTLPEAKSAIGWIDHDRVYVGFGDYTSSGYPRTVREWRRGTPLDEATPVFEARHTDMLAAAGHDPTPGFERDIVERHIDFYRTDTYLLTDGGLVRVDVPEDATVEFHREWLLVSLRTEWLGHPAGSLLVAKLDDFLAGQRILRPVFTPSPDTALAGWAWTRDHLIVTAMSDVASRPSAVALDGTTTTPLAPPGTHTVVTATNPDHSDGYLLITSGFTEPDTLRYGRIGAPPDVVKQEPAFFDASGLSVRQFFATSDDGTRVPYFVVGSPAPGPTLLHGYGGFQISKVPEYDGVLGRAWLARGGTYAVANIRGGGEYGPDWHRAALRENRPRAYEDFAAVARDLVARGITTPAQLGAQGGSNGGLLMGVMLTRYPTLFGAIVCQVPLLDMRRYHVLLAGASWMAEYGDPDDESDWAYLRRFSPYHNVAPGRSYPPILLVTSTRDDRVHPGHARKMVALLEEYGYDVTYYENIEGGHGAAADNRQRAIKSALMYDFLWQRLR